MGGVLPLICLENLLLQYAARSSALVSGGAGRSGRDVAWGTAVCSARVRATLLTYYYDSTKFNGGQHKTCCPGAPQDQTLNADRDITISSTTARTQSVPPKLTRLPCPAVATTTQWTQTKIKTRKTKQETPARHSSTAPPKQAGPPCPVVATTTLWTHTRTKRKATRKTPALRPTTSRPIPRQAHTPTVQLASDHPPGKLTADKTSMPANS